MTYVVLESQYQSSLTKACQAINESREDVCVECVGYLLEELRDDVNLAAFKKDLETSNIFIGSLIFVQVGAVSFALSLPHMPRGTRVVGCECRGKSRRRPALIRSDTSPWTARNTLPMSPSWMLLLKEVVSTRANENRVTDVD